MISKQQMFRPIACAMAAALGIGAAAQSSASHADEYAAQWGLQAINAASAYNYLDSLGLPVGGDGIIVAIGDDGVGPNTPELAGRVALGPLNAVTGNHGTFIAGVIAAAYDGRGIMGVAFNSTVMAANDNNPIQFQTAAQQGARVLSMSFAEGEPPRVEALRAALYGAASFDVVMVASLGQDDEPGHGWPVGFASDPQVGGSMIAVGSVDQNWNLVSFPCGSRSQAQPNYCLVAPGEGILGAVAPGQEGEEDQLTQIDGITVATGGGTSFAVPFVSGAAAVLRAANPDLSAADIVQILLQSATPLHAPGEDTSQISPTFGWGMLNLDAAVRMAVQ